MRVFELHFQKWSYEPWFWIFETFCTQLVRRGVWKYFLLMFWKLLRSMWTCAVTWDTFEFLHLIPQAKKWALASFEGFSAPFSKMMIWNWHLDFWTLLHAVGEIICLKILSVDVLQVFESHVNLCRHLRHFWLLHLIPQAKKCALASFEGILSWI